MPQTTTPTEDQRLTNYEISTIRCLMTCTPPEHGVGKRPWLSRRRW